MLLLLAPIVCLELLIKVNFDLYFLRLCGVDGCHVDVENQLRVRWDVTPNPFFSVGFRRRAYYLGSRPCLELQERFVPALNHVAQAHLELKWLPMAKR